MKYLPVQKNFVSELDQLLQAFDSKHPVPSKYQRKEQEKYRRVSFLRDTPSSTEEPNKHWEKF